MAMQGGFGVKLQITVTATLTTIVHLLDMDYPKLARTVADMTGHNATSGYAEYVSTGRYDAESFTALIGWDDAETTHTTIMTAFNAAAAVEFAIIDPGTTETLTFDAFVIGMERMSKQDDGYKCEIELQPTGPVVIT